MIRSHCYPKFLLPTLLDFPVIAHMEFADSGEDEEPGPGWIEVNDILDKLGKLSKSSPYKYRGYQPNFPPSKRHLVAIPFKK